MYADLHIHSYFSDGSMSPEEIVKRAKEKEVKVLAVTDHNVTCSWERFKKAALEAGIRPIRGVEINCMYQNQVMHLLAYGFEEHKHLMALIEKAHRLILKMSEDLVEKLAHKYQHISLEDYKAYTYPKNQGGWKGLHYIYEKNLSKTLFEGFKYYKDYGCDFTEYDFPKLEEVIKAIKLAGGYSVVAHPGNYYHHMEECVLRGHLEELLQTGIQGIECYYPTHSELLTHVCVSFCKAHDLLITAGSDEHGVFGLQAKTMIQEIGCLPISQEMLRIAPLLEQEIG